MLSEPCNRLVKGLLLCVLLRRNVEIRTDRKAVRGAAVQVDLVRHPDLLQNDLRLVALFV